MVVDNKYNIGQTVYLKTDLEQSPRMITKIVIIPNSLFYVLNDGITMSEHYEVEISEEKNALINI